MQLFVFFSHQKKNALSVFWLGPTAPPQKKKAEVVHVKIFQKRQAIHERQLAKSILAEVTVVDDRGNIASGEKFPVNHGKTMGKSIGKSWDILPCKSRLIYSWEKDPFHRRVGRI
jgi:hypothetical protein